MRLALFDIDGTLLLGKGAGARAMNRAGKAVLGPAFTIDGIDFAGALDPWIYETAAVRLAFGDARAKHDLFRVAYLEALIDELAAGTPPVLLPGIDPLLRRLEAMGQVTLGPLEAMLSD